MDNLMQPYRTDIYLLLDREYRLLGYHSRTYACRAIWAVVIERLF
jgi:hypothetical protein